VTYTKGTSFISVSSNPAKNNRGFRRGPQETGEVLRLRATGGFADSRQDNYRAQRRSDSPPSVTAKERDVGRRHRRLQDQRGHQSATSNNEWRRRHAAEVDALTAAPSTHRRRPRRTSKSRDRATPREPSNGRHCQYCDRRHGGPMKPAHHRTDTVSRNCVLELSLDRMDCVNCHVM